jgi:membrane-associated phospholipid phosphatase
LPDVTEPEAAERDDAERRVERVLEHSLERVQTPEAARKVVARVERMARGKTEAERAADATAAPASAASEIESAAHQPQPEVAVASILQATAQESVAATPAAEPVLQAAQATLTPSAPVSPQAARGRNLLKQAALRRMGPLQAFDASIYMAINGSPHPGWLDSVAWAIAVVFVGGWIWVIGTLIAYLLRVPKSWLAFERLLPMVVGATWLVEIPIKAFFRRRRPFVHIVRALVIGKKPGSWSFPSGHTASSFASAWALSTVWPRKAPFFFGLAGIVGLSRVYVGAHYPGDVASGAFLGILLSEAIRRLMSGRWRLVGRG